MREFIPSDYIDKEGNVYETVGENIREGKNGAVTSDFPTPKDIGNGLIGSDGTNYVSVLKNLSTGITNNAYQVVGADKNGLLRWEPVKNAIVESGDSYYPISNKAVVDYLALKIPNIGANYSWVTVNVSYADGVYSINGGLIISSNGAIYSQTKNVIDLFPISGITTTFKSANYSRGFTDKGKTLISWDVKCSYTAKILVEG